MCVKGLVACFPRIFHEAERSEGARRSHASAQSGEAAMPNGKPHIDATDDANKYEIVVTE